MECEVISVDSSYGPRVAEDVRRENVEKEKRKRGALRDPSRDLLVPENSLPTLR